MQALAAFVQKDIRYVAIELGIGGRAAASRHGGVHASLRRLQGQGHPALLDAQGDRRRLALRDHQHGARLRHASTRRRISGSITPSSPSSFPPGSTTEALPGGGDAPKLGNVLFFDPTQTLVPFGRLPGALQANYGMLVTPEGGELRAAAAAPRRMRTA